MKKPEGAKASKCEDEGVDFISNMPDAILVSILSRLPYTEEAIGTSILSRRWRYLWTEIPFININCYRHRENFKKNKFKEFVYWVLLNQSVDLDRFRLFCSNYYSMSTVGRWIHAAVKRNVKQLELTFCPKKDNTEKNDDVEMPHCLVTCPSLQVFKLNFLPGCLLRLPNIKGFPALRVLHLANVDLLEQDHLLKDFLESCPLLEEVSLIDCCTCSLDLLFISCLKLKKLTIENVDEEEGMCGGIKLSCPQLVQLNLRGYIAYDLFFESLDSLKEALIQPKLEGDTIQILPVLFARISNVESLLIDFYFFCQCINAASDPGLPNLKTLVLTSTMGAFTFDEFIQISKYYPKLESFKLIIKEEFHEKYEWLDEDETRRILTPDVKRVEFFEFNGEKPKVVIKWFEDILEMFFTWGKASRFSCQYV